MSRPPRSSPAQGSPNPAADRTFRQALRRRAGALTATIALTGHTGQLSPTSERDRREQVPFAWLYLRRRPQARLVTGAADVIAELDAVALSDTSRDGGEQ
ncbi:hypothetical protein O7627_33405 [Solwaraspora sp. WMMD1047]|uniref:hypothetical protein n=1 Tax=Solwaraspora sp. WMMD1047 TaxID=3016102 RepID=UPI002416A435|nr:hypothetical protein [Solwaraspora sp. WMMD1047]MDG4834164.1 hypothetical protein [Solwaraspora sp. WMMD1047]